LIFVEVATSSAELKTGLVGHAPLKPYQGMLFVHPRPGYWSYTMRGMTFPLDILWLDRGLRIVDLVEDAKAAPYPSPAFAYGGKVLASYGLELAAGMARRYGLAIGAQLTAAR
jgi:hypothetical protein